MPRLGELAECTVGDHCLALLEQSLDWGCSAFNLYLQFICPLVGQNQLVHSHQVVRLQWFRYAEHVSVEELAFDEAKLLWEVTVST